MIGIDDDGDDGDDDRGSDGGSDGMTVAVACWNHGGCDSDKVLFKVARLFQ